MRSISFITIHPKIIEAYKSFGVMRAAETSKIATIESVDLRDYAADKHGSVDDSPYGGGDGMVMRADCLEAALASVHARKTDGKAIRVIFTSPSGILWNQNEAAKMAEGDEHLVFICGRFAGVDQRFIDECVDAEYSLGDVVYAGGELPSLLMAESFLRLVPGVLGHKESAVEDSFGKGLDGYLEYPSYTRPSEWKGLKVPEILLSGDHKAIRDWREKESVRRTRERRPDLLR